MKKTILCAAGIAAIFSISDAQFFIARNTDGNYAYHQDNGISTNSGSDSFNDLDTTQFGSTQVNVHETLTGSGILVADATYTDGYQVTGPLTSFSKITMTTQLQLNNAFVGAPPDSINTMDFVAVAYAKFAMINPGEFHFYGSTANDFSLPQGETYTALQIFDGGKWNDIYNTKTVAANVVNYDQSGILGPGSYRLITQTHGDAFGSQNQLFTYSSATLEVVPEPATALLILPLLALAKRRRLSR